MSAGWCCNIREFLLRHFIVELTSSNVSIQPFSVHYGHSMSDQCCIIVGSQGRCKLFQREQWLEVVWVGTGIVASPLLSIDIMTTCKAISFGIEPARAISQDHIEGGQVFRPTKLAV